MGRSRARRRRRAPDRARPPARPARRRRRLRLPVRAADGRGITRTRPWSSRGAGAAVERTELRLSVWDEASGAWRTLDSATGPTSDGGLTLTRRRCDPRASGPAGVAEILVQSVPRAEPTLDGSARTALRRPGGLRPRDQPPHRHAVPDRGVSRGLRRGRRLDPREPRPRARSRSRPTRATSCRTGSTPTRPSRARAASSRSRREIQAMLDDAGMPNSVLPGNHDNKRGITNELFNEYFGPDRYDGRRLVRRIDRAGRQQRELLDVRAGGRAIPHAVAALRVRRARARVGGGRRGAASRSQRHRLDARARDARGARQSGRPLGRLAVGVARRRAVGAGRRAEPERRRRAVGSLPRPRTHRHRERGRHRRATPWSRWSPTTRSSARTRGSGRPASSGCCSSISPAGAIAVDTFSSNLGAHASLPVRLRAVRARERARDDARRTRGRGTILDAGLQDRYTAADDDFGVPIAFQYDKAVAHRRACSCRGGDPARAAPATLKP